MYDIICKDSPSQNLCRLITKNSEMEITVKSLRVRQLDLLDPKLEDLAAIGAIADAFAVRSWARRDPAKAEQEDSEGGDSCAQQRLPRDL